MHRGCLVLLAACGRIGFGAGAGDGGSGSGSDAAGVGDAPFLSAPMCTTPAQRFPIDTAGGNTWVTTITTAATASGFGLAYVAPDGTPYGLTFNGSPGQLTSIVADTALAGSNQQALSVAVTGNDQLMFAIEDSGETALAAFDVELAAANEPANYAVQMVTGALANVSGDIIWLTTTASSEVDGHVVTDAGSAGSAVPLVMTTTAQQPTSVTAIPAAGDLLVTWVDADANPPAVETQSFDAGLNPVTSASAISVGSSAAMTPRAAWSTQHDVYAFTWVENGEVEVELASSSLAPIGAPVAVAAGSEPKIASDGDGFWLAWHDLSQPSLLAAAYVGPTGGVTHYNVKGTTGTEVDHDIVDVDGTAMLIWDERGGTGNPLWAVPMCGL